jgi:hypothetical protein
MNSVFFGNRAQVAGGLMLLNATLGNEKQWKLVFDSNKGIVASADLAEIPVALTVEYNAGSPLPTNRTYSNPKTVSSEGYLEDSKQIVIDYVTLQEHSVVGYEGKTTYVILPSGQPVISYVHYYTPTSEQVPYGLVFRVVALNRFGSRVTSVTPTSSCTVQGRRRTKGVNSTTTFLTNYTTQSTFYFNASKGGYDLDEI